MSIKMTTVSALLCVVLCLGVALGTPLRAASSDAVAQRLSSEIDHFKSIMLTGSADIGLPVVDPLVEATIPIEADSSIFKASGSISDLRVEGLSGFSVTKLVQQSGDANSGRVTLAVQIPQASASCAYDLKGKLQLGFVSVPLSGTSTVTATVTGITAGADLDITINSDNSVTIDKISNVSYNFKKAKVNVKAFNGITNNLLNTFIPTIVKSNRKAINAAIEEQGKENINKYFDLEAGKTPKSSMTLSATAASLLDRLVVPAHAEAILLEILHHVHPVVAA